MDPNTQGATKADLADLKTEFKADLADLKTEFKADLADLRAEFKADLRTEILAVEQRMQGRMDAQEQRLKDWVAEVVRDSETRLLQAFYGFAQTNDRKLKQSEVTTEAVSGRVTALEGRVLELEKRLNIPPTQ